MSGYAAFAKLSVELQIAMLVLHDVLTGFTERMQGPMHLGLIMQPLMASYLAFRDGKKDASDGKSPYFWDLFIDPEHRREKLQSGWNSIGKVFIATFVLDVIFQFIVFHRPQFRGGAIWAGIILALLPYVLLRGPFNRCGERKHRKPNPALHEWFPHPRPHSLTPNCVGQQLTLAETPAFRSPPISLLLTRLTVATLHWH